MKLLLTILLLFITITTINAQGCSDAGFCSLGVLKTKMDSAKHTISIGANYGAGEEGTSTINPYAEFSYHLNKSWAFQTKITATYANGFLGNKFNLGDVYGFAVYSPKLKGSNILSLLGGVKVPLTSANDKFNGKPLPLDYQSSIGTYDVIAGANYVINKKWELNAGLQVPVIQVNKNTFFPDEFTDARIASFTPTNNFRRKSDALVRVGYYINLPSSSITIKPNLLAIYHLGKDSYENRFGKRTEINNSDGLTLNGGLIITKKFRNNNRFEIVAATPFIVRDVRPDGLTRSAVINLQYSFNF